MSAITTEVAALLRQRGYDASAGHWDGVGDSHPPTDFVIVRAVAVVGWRYPNGQWFWQDRAALLVDNGLDPLCRFAQPPYFDTAHRWEWLPARPSAPEEHPRDTASTAQLSKWMTKRLPLPTTPTCLLYPHPDENERNPDLAAEMCVGLGRGPGPQPTVWSWAPDWYQAWAEVDDSPTRKGRRGVTNVAKHRT
jgi:hypothetical protein